MQLKYRDYHKYCSPCPPKSAKELGSKIVAYRFVSDEILKSRDFDPPAIENPRRTFREAEAKCGAYALSYFMSEEDARNKYKKLIKANRQLAKKWKFIAKSDIRPEDGVVVGPTSGGHIDLHESRIADMKSNSAVIGKL